MGRSRKTKPQYSRLEFKTGPLVKQFLTQLQIQSNFSSGQITLLRPHLTSRKITLLQPPKEQVSSPSPRPTSNVPHNIITRRSHTSQGARNTAQKPRLICNPSQLSPRIIGCRCCQGCLVLSRTYTRIPRSVLVPGDCKHKAGCRFARVLSDEGDDVQVTRDQPGAEDDGVRIKGGPSLAQRAHSQLAQAEVARAETAGGRGFEAAIIRDDGRVERVTYPSVPKATEVKITEAGERDSHAAFYAQPPASQAAEDKARQSLLVVQRQRDAALEEQEEAAKRRKRLVSRAEILDKNMSLLRGQLKTQKRRYREQSAEWKAQLKLLKKRRKEMKKRGELDGEAVKAS